MKYGVRNNIQATVKKIKKGDVMSQIECSFDACDTLSSVLTTDSLEDLVIKPGDKVKLLVKAIHVIPVKE